MSRNIHPDDVSVSPAGRTKQTPAYKCVFDGKKQTHSHTPVAAGRVWVVVFEPADFPPATFLQRIREDAVGTHGRSCPIGRQMSVVGGSNSKAQPMSSDEEADRKLSSD